MKIKCHFFCWIVLITMALRNWKFETTLVVLVVKGLYCASFTFHYFFCLNIWGYMSLCCCFRRKVNTHNCIHTVEISVTITFMAFPFLQMAALQPPFNCFKSNWNALRQNIERCEYPPLPSDRYSLDVSYIINCCSLFFLFAFKSSLKFRCNTWWDLV